MSGCWTANTLTGDVFVYKHDGEVHKDGPKSMYAGKLANGQPDGSGVMIKKTYDGQAYVYDYYQGSWKHGLLHGMRCIVARLRPTSFSKIPFVFENENHMFNVRTRWIYWGHMKYGKRHGDGVYASDGAYSIVTQYNYFKGEWNDDHVGTGHCIFTYSPEHTLMHHEEDCSRFGGGKLSSLCYEGDVVDGYKHGRGHLYAEMEDSDKT
jgi:hypothetical protein